MKEVREIVWPAPPAMSRIQFVGVLQSGADFRKTTGEVLMEALLGPRHPVGALSQPMGVAVSSDSKRLYVTDHAKGAVVLFDLEAQRVVPLGGDGGEFKTPLGIALDSHDNVYVVDSTAKCVFVFDPRGRLVRTLTHEKFERPTGIAVDPARRRIYVADSAPKGVGDHVIRVLDLEGNDVASLGRLGSGAGQFAYPSYLTLDAHGNLYVADTMNARVQVLTPDGDHLRTIGERGDAFGMLDKPKGVALDGFGNVYVVDSSWSNVQIFNQRGEVLLFFGGRGRFPGLLFNPTGIAIDRQNRIYVADAFNGRIAIYQLINTKAEDSFAVLPTRPGQRR